MVDACAHWRWHAAEFSDRDANMRHGVLFGTWIALSWATSTWRWFRASTQRMQQALRTLGFKGLRAAFTVWRGDSAVASSSQHAGRNAAHHRFRSLQRHQSCMLHLWRLSARGASSTARRMRHALRVFAKRHEKRALVCWQEEAHKKQALRRGDSYSRHRRSKCAVERLGVAATLRRDMTACFRRAQEHFTSTRRGAALLNWRGEASQQGVEVPVRRRRVAWRRMASFYLDRCWGQWHDVLQSQHDLDLLFIEAKMVRCLRVWRNHAARRRMERFRERHRPLDIQQRMRVGKLACGWARWLTGLTLDGLVTAHYKSSPEAVAAAAALMSPY